MAIKKATLNDPPSPSESRTVEVVIDLAGIRGGHSSITIRNAPVPVTFDYLAAQLASDPSESLSSPHVFATQNQSVKVEVVDGPSDFDAATMTGHINVDQPLCQYYSKFYFPVIELGRELEDASKFPADVSIAKVNSERTTVDVGPAHISFMRTLRVPDDEKTYSLPAGLGKFLLYNVAGFADRLPSSIVDKGGLLMPMHQCEAMWMDFDGGVGRERCAIKVSAGGINALTGLPQEKSSDGRQDYMPLTDRGHDGQMWLDRFSTSKGVVRQFVAVPLGQSLTVESQLTGKETSSSLQIDVFPAWKTPKSFKCGYTELDGLRSPRQQQLSVGAVVQWPEERSSGCFLSKDGESGSKRFSIVNPPKYVRTLRLSAHRKDGRIYVKDLRGDVTVISVSIHYDTVLSIKERMQDFTGAPVMSQRLIYAGLQLHDDSKTLSEYHVTYGSTLYLVMRLVGGGYPPHMRIQGFGAGGKITQKIVRDTLPASAYDFDSGTRVHITIVDPQLLASLTGQPPIPTPITIDAYKEAGIPWFDLYDEGVTVANNVARDHHALMDVKSVQQILGKRRAEEPKKFQCSYCSTIASYELQPCGHLLCEGCAEGMAESECPRRCKNVRDRVQIPAAVLADIEAGHCLPEAGSSDARIVTLKRCADRGVIGTFIRSEDKVSSPSSGAI